MTESLIPGITDVSSPSSDTEQVSPSTLEEAVAVVQEVIPESTVIQTVPTGTQGTISACGNCGQCMDCIMNTINSRIQDVDQFDTNLKILVYSDPGARKSSFCAGAPNSLTIDIEKGFLSVQALKKSRPELVSPTSRLLPYKSFFQVEKLIEGLSLNHPNFDWVEVLGIDSASELHKRGYAEILEREFATGVRKSRYVSGDDNNSTDHSENNEHIRRLISSLRDLDRHIIMTAHARRVEQKDKSFKIYPDFSEKLANTIVGIMDVVAFVEPIETPNGFIMRWHFQSDYAMCKERIGINQPFLDDPTYSDLYVYYEALKKA